MDRVRRGSWTTRRTDVRARANPAAQAFENLADRYDAWHDTASGRMLFDLGLPGWPGIQLKVSECGQRC